MGLLEVIAIVVLPSFLWAIVLMVWLRKCLSDYDPALRFGLAGLTYLFSLGWFTFLLGHVQNGVWVTSGLHFIGIFVVQAVLFKSFKSLEGSLADKLGQLGVSLPKLETIKASSIALVACTLFLVVGILTVVSTSLPSDMNDWDSLAYHLAVPKIWNLEGQITYIPFIHHSNFPFVVDSLFMLKVATAAKGFSATYLLFGMPLVFGMARTLWGQNAGWWSVLAFVGVPVVLWESGTAYIDVAHGLYGLVAALFLTRVLGSSPSRADWMCLAFGLAGAMSSKYTGYQLALAIGLVGLTSLVLQKQVSRLKPAILVFAAAVAVSSPWLIRNTINTGNPFYPFFYEVFGGSNWDGFMAKIYKNEQKTFGVGNEEGKLDVSKVGHAVLGLAYQPGRYVNPGQQQGLGAPTGAIGFCVVVAGLLSLLQLKKDREARTMLAVVGVLLVMWFVLSQQSRYLTLVALPLSLLAGALSVRGPTQLAVRGMIAVQLAASLFLVWHFSLSNKMPVLTGEVSRYDYEIAGSGGFAAVATTINIDPTIEKVALYDEVFGYFLNKPYIWANPGHSKLLPHEDVVTPEVYVRALYDLDISHIYMNFRFEPPENRTKWFASAGLVGTPEMGYSAEERAAILANREVRWKVILADAIKEGRLVPIGELSPRYALLRIDKSRAARPSQPPAYIQPEP